MSRRVKHRHLFTSHTSPSLPAPTAPAVCRRGRRKDPGYLLRLRGGGRCAALPCAARPGLALPCPALPGPARRPRLLRRGRPGCTGGARGRPGARLAPRGVRRFLVRPRRAALAPTPTPPAPGGGGGGVRHPQRGFQKKKALRKELRSSARSHRYKAPRLLLPFVHLLKCLPSPLLPSTIPTGGSGVACVKRGGAIPPTPRRAAAAAGSPGEPAGRGAARPGGGAGRCRRRGRRRQRWGASCAPGRIPPTPADFGEEGAVRKLPPRTVRRPSGFLARSMQLRKIKK